MIRKLGQASDVTLLCINDDVAMGHDEVSIKLKNWLSERWKHPAAWEL